MKFRCAGITDSCIDGLEYSPALCIFFQGCTLKCPSCQNPSLQDATGGEEMDTDEIIWIASSHNDFYRGMVFTGGDPLEQPEALYELASKLDFPKVLYTGRKYEEIKPELRDLFDIIVDGPYVEELKTGGFPASSNQVVTRKGK